MSEVGVPGTQIRRFFAEIRPEHVAVMISGKAGMAVRQYEPLLASVPLA